MIKIRVHSSSFVFRYKGAIEIYHDDEFLYVDAQSIIQELDSLMLCEGKVWDRFWLDDIKSIRGEPNDYMHTRP